MLSNLFSKNKFSKNKTVEHQADDQSQQNVHNFLDAYRSKAFPFGLLSVSKGLEITSDKKALTIKALLPFPCDGELHDIAEQLTAKMQQTVNFDVEYQVDTATIKAENKNETCQLSPKIKCAAIPAQKKVTRHPSVISLVITGPTLLISDRFKVSPPSKRIILMAKETK